MALETQYGLFQVGALLLIHICLADDCYTIDMTDSYGDGWSFGSGLDVTVGGVSIANGTITGPFGCSSGQLTFATVLVLCCIRMY